MSYKKYGTEGHIIKTTPEKKTYPKYIPTKGRVCRYKDSKGKCTAEGYINCGNDCKRPGYCNNFTAVWEQLGIFK